MHTGTRSCFTFLGKDKSVSDFMHFHALSWAANLGPRKEMERQAGENRRKHVYVCAGFFGRGGGQIRATEECMNGESKRQNARVGQHKRQSSVWPCILTSWKTEWADQGRMLSLQCGNNSSSLKEPLLFLQRVKRKGKVAFKESSLTS